jgi:hypothetical protein
VHILESVLALEESRVLVQDKKKYGSVIQEQRHELLLKSAEHLNFTFEDRVYFIAMNDDALEEAIDGKLVGVLERGVFVC